MCPERPKSSSPQDSVAPFLRNVKVNNHLQQASVWAASEARCSHETYLVWCLIRLNTTGPPNRRMGLTLTVVVMNLCLEKVCSYNSHSMYCVTASVYSGVHHSWCFSNNLHTGNNAWTYFSFHLIDRSLSESELNRLSLDARQTLLSASSVIVKLTNQDNLTFYKTYPMPFHITERHPPETTIITRQ